MRIKRSKIILIISSLLLLTLGFFVFVVSLENRNKPNVTIPPNGEIVDKNSDDNTNNEEEYIKVVVLDKCDTNNITKPNTRSNISREEKYDYFGYTDSLGRLYKVTADILHHKNEGGRSTGQMCDNRYPSNSNQEAKDAIGFITGGMDDRGHAIGDQFDGVSNSYNITSQDRKTNQTIFVAFENYLAKTISKNKGSVTNYELIAHYDGESRRPYKYSVSVDINKKKVSIEFYNDGTKIIGEYK